MRAKVLDVAVDVCAPASLTLLAPTAVIVRSAEGCTLRSARACEAPITKQRAPCSAAAQLQLFLLTSSCQKPGTHPVSVLLSSKDEIHFEIQFEYELI